MSKRGRTASAEVISPSNNRTDKKNKQELSFIDRIFDEHQAAFDRDLNEASDIDDMRKLFF